MFSGLVTLCVLACVSFAHAAGESCSSNNGCGIAEFCRWEDGTCSSVDGVCRPRTDYCTPDERVCGCNGLLYQSECLAFEDGVSAGPASRCSTSWFRTKSPAAEAWKNSLMQATNPAGILGSNFDVQIRSYSFNTPSAFAAQVNNVPAFRRFIAARVGEHCRIGVIGARCAGAIDQSACTAMRTRLESTWVQIDSSPFSSHKWALYLYRLDQDNWFSYNSAFESLENFVLFDNDRQLYTMNGFQSKGIFTCALSSIDLPVIVDRKEQTISIITVQLFD